MLSSLQLLLPLLFRVKKSQPYLNRLLMSFVLEMTTSEKNHSSELCLWEEEVCDFSILNLDPHKIKTQVRYQLIRMYI